MLLPFGCCLQAEVVHCALDEPGFSAVTVQPIVHAVEHALQILAVEFVHVLGERRQAAVNGVIHLRVRFVLDLRECGSPRIGRVYRVLPACLRVNGRFVEDQGNIAKVAVLHVRPRDRNAGHGRAAQREELLQLLFRQVVDGKQCPLFLHRIFRGKLDNVRCVRYTIFESRANALLLVPLSGDRTAGLDYFLFLPKIKSTSVWGKNPDAMRLVSIGTLYYNRSIPDDLIYGNWRSKSKALYVVMALMLNVVINFNPALYNSRCFHRSNELRIRINIPNHLSERVLIELDLPKSLTIHSESLRAIMLIQLFPHQRFIRIPISLGTGMYICGCHRFHLIKLIDMTAYLLLDGQSTVALFRELHHSSFFISRGRRIRRHPVEHLCDGAHVLRRERRILTPARALGELLEGVRQFLEELVDLLKQAVLVVVQIAHELLVRQHRRCGVGHDFLTRHVLGVAERVHLAFDQIVHILPIHKC